MRSLGLTLASKFKQITLFPQKPNTSYTIFNPQTLLLCNSYSITSYSSNSNSFPYDKTNHIAKIVSLLQHAKSSVLATQIHGHILKLGLTNDMFVQNNLIKIYTRYGVLSGGLNVFDEMSDRNLFSWALIISGVIRNEEFELGLDLYLDMTRNGFVPNEFVLGSVLKGCAHVEARDFGLCIHSLTLKIGLENNPFVCCSLLNFYVRLKDIGMMEMAFDCMDTVDTGCWNAVIGGYAQFGYGFEALSKFSTMKYKGVKMDSYTFINALQGCSVLEVGTQIHGLIIRNQMETETSVMNALMDMYNKTGAEKSALKVFKSITNKDIVSWNTIFGNFSKYSKENPHLFKEFMLTITKPNHITFSILFRQCGALLDFNLGPQFHCLALKFGFFAHFGVLSSLINMFSSYGEMEMAHFAFDSMLPKDISVWNELIFGYVSSGFELEALLCFCDLWKSGVEANEYTFSIILEACSRSGNQQIGTQIHGTTMKKGFTSNGSVQGSLIKAYVFFGKLADSFGFLNEDIKSWGTMISALVHRGYNYEAINFLPRVLEIGMKPDEYILGSMLNSCANVAASIQTKTVHPLIIKLGYESQVFVASAVIDAYAKCGDIKAARRCFDESSELNDVIIYNAMIMGYAHHGLVMKAIEILEKIKLGSNLQPSQATFVAIISACSHKGLIDEGFSFFELMKSEYGMEPSPHIYGVLVDMFSRSGRLEFSKHLIESMPFRPWPAILRSMLSGCNIHRNFELGAWAANTLQV
ncbi:hypothetical protein ACFE04_013593 [Oxalis oulophora]